MELRGGRAERAFGALAELIELPH